MFTQIISVGALSAISLAVAPLAAPGIQAHMESRADAKAEHHQEQRVEHSNTGSTGFGFGFGRMDTEAKEEAKTELKNCRLLTSKDERKECRTEVRLNINSAVHINN